MVTLIGVLAAVVLAALGEMLHARRVRRLARLAFGPKARPALWARVAAALRAPAFGGVAWGLFTLLGLPPRVHQGDEVIREQDWRRLVLVLDVSPSMRLQDAGPTAEQSRSRRARDLIDSLFQRVAIARYRISVVAVYNGAKPVVIDTTDSEVVRNILSDLPMQYAFPSGKTKLLDGVAEAARIAKPWPARSTMLVLVTDGDTVPATGMPALPPSISGVLVVGVGDPLAGKFIDGHQSRQDASTLRQIAARLGGHFHDGNRLQLPTDLIRAAAQESEESAVEKLTIREYALMAVAFGSAFLALLPFLLHFLGTAWRPGKRGPDPPRVRTPLSGRRA